MANSAVFNFRQNAGSDWISLTEIGREFQARDAAAGNARSPMVARRVGGTTSVDVVADRRRRRPCTSAVDWSVSASFVNRLDVQHLCLIWVYDLPFQSYDDYNFPLTASLKSQFLRLLGLSNFIVLTPKRHFLGVNDV